MIFSLVLSLTKQPGSLFLQGAGLLFVIKIRKSWQNRKPKKLQSNAISIRTMHLTRMPSTERNYFLKKPLLVSANPLRLIPCERRFLEVCSESCVSSCILDPLTAFCRITTAAQVWYMNFSATI